MAKNIFTGFLIHAMGLVNNVNRVLNAKSTGIFLFGFTGAYKVMTDYQKAPKEEKKKVLLRDSAILAGSALGLATYSQGRKNFIASPLKKNCSKFIDNSFEKLKKTKLWKKFCSSAGNYLKKPAEAVIKNSYNIGKDCLDNTLMVASGILGAVATDYLIQISHFHKNIIDKEIETKSGIKTKHVSQIDKEMMNTPMGEMKRKYPTPKPKLQNKEEDNNSYIDPFTKFKTKIRENVITNDFGNIVNEETKKNILSNITNMPEMRIFNSTMIGLQSFEIAEEKTFKEKLRHTTKSLLTNTLVPMFFLSLASNLTKGMKKGIVRLPIVFTTMVAGTIIANKQIEKQINKKA